jgi:long-chain acyl-CoA synthetase
LAQGEYISPERLENLYIVHPAIATIFVHGDSTQTQLIAIIGVDPEPFAGWASKVVRRPIAISDIQTVYQDPAIIKQLLKELDHIAERKKLQGFEKIKGIYLATDPFTVENELLTPTMKLKRADAAKAFRREIDELYKRGNEKNGKVSAKL